MGACVFSQSDDMKRQKVLIAVILCFLIGNICKGKVELNFSDFFFFFCIAIRDISGRIRIPEIPRTFCDLIWERKENKGASKQEFF